MSFTERFTEQYQLGAVEYADSLAAATYNGAWQSMRDFHRAVAILIVGDIQVGGTVDFILQQATDTAGTGAKAITGKAITQLTQAGGDGDEACIIELRTEELDVSNGFDCIRWRLTLGTAASEVAVLVLRGSPPRYQPVSTTAWTEVVT